MRLAGYNTSRLNVEPLNGKGIYRIGSSLVATRLIANSMAPATLSVSRNLLAGILVVIVPLRHLISRVESAEIGIIRDIRLLVDQSTVSIYRHLPAGVISSIRLLRRIPMIGHSLAGSISRTSLTSGITPHTSSSSIGG